MRSGGLKRVLLHNEAMDMLKREIWGLETASGIQGSILSVAYSSKILAQS